MAAVITETFNDAGVRNAHSEAAAAPQSRAIEVIHARDLPYEAFLQHYLRAGRPVIIRDAVTAWPALRKWTPQYFKENFGDREVQVSYSKRMRLADFVDAVLASSAEQPGPYLYRLFLHEEFADVLPDLIPQNPYGFPRRHVSALMPEAWRRPDGFLKLLMGGPGSKFPIMHYDAEHAHAQITEIYGEKAYVLFAPHETPNVYASPAQPNLSLVDRPDQPDLTRFPLMAKATPHVGSIGPGEMIFIPEGWWHSARPLTVSISVCTAILDQSNWAGFAHDISAAAPGGAWQRTLLRQRLRASGMVMHAMEMLQHAMPGLARRLRLPALLAPISADAVPEPSATPLDIRIRTP